MKNTTSKPTEKNNKTEIAKNKPRAIASGIKVWCRHDELKDVTELVENPRNPNKHSDKQIALLAKIIRGQGWRQPITISNRSGFIVKGHGRIQAAKVLNVELVPVEYQDYENEAAEYADLLADNRIAELAEPDAGLIDDLLKDVMFEDFDMDLTGFEITPPFEGNDDDFDADAVADEIVEPITKLGDIWTLGRHRLMCGDSTDKATVDRLMDGQKANISFTDPPYGIAIVKGNSIGRSGETHFGKVGGGNIVETNTYAEIIGDDTTDTARSAYTLMVDNSDNQIIFGGNYFTDFLPPKPCWCIWDKQNTGNFADVEMAWTSYDKGARLYRWMWNGLIREGDRKYELNKRVHPTQKPVGMIAAILSDFTSKEDKVLDLFGGSGSTLIACEQLNRTCYMMELDPKYCDVIIKRWETLTGDKAVIL